MSVSTQPGAKRIGSGGEADVYTVPGRPELVEKRYRRADPTRARKLRVMLDHPPEEARRAGAITLAWPRELVTDASGGIAGFLMPRVDLTTSVPLFQVYNPQSRRQVAPAFTWRYLVRTARNVAAIVDTLHGAGYVIGDLNESNLLVSRQALVALVDCDSIQVRDPATAEVHRCLVGKPEFLPPEHQGRDLAQLDRTTRGDDFSLAALVFLLLMEGVHPFAGVWRGRGDAPDLSQRMRARRFPYAPLSRMKPPPAGLPLRTLPRRVRWMAARSFVLGATIPSARPTAAQWRDALEDMERSLRACDRSPHHEFARHLRRCPWCDRIDAGLHDPFPGPSGQSALTARPPSKMSQVRRRVNAAASTAGRVVISAARRAAARAGGPVALAATAAAAAWWFPLMALPALFVGVPILLAARAAPAPSRAGRIPGRRVLRHIRATARLLRTGGRSWGTWAAAAAAAAASASLAADRWVLDLDPIRAAASVTAACLVTLVPTRVRAWRRQHQE